MSDTFFHIGISGHRQLGDERTIQFVAQQFAKLLMEYCDRVAQGAKLVVYTALAVGADQLFASKALELGIPVEAIIPCECYEDMFVTPDSRAEYARLLQACQQVHRLPIHDCSEEAYLAAGHWVVEESDVVVVAWNGYPAAGKGGTADVVDYARLRGRSWVHIDTRQHTVQIYEGG